MYGRLRLALLRVYAVTCAQYAGLPVWLMIGKLLFTRRYGT
jgi:hypothetical protein